MKDKIVNLKNKIVSFFINLKNRVVPTIIANKKSAIIALVALIIVILAIFIIFPKKEVGNTTGNLYNSGFSENIGNRVYYLGYKEGRIDGIYRVKRKKTRKSN